MQKPSIPKGTRDFSPAEMVKRNYIFNTIKKVFELYGYSPIETPAVENLNTLLGKYGEEGDKLLFRILNSGDFLKDIDLNSFEEIRTEDPNFASLGSKICEKGLRYDLTVPFARYVVQHQSDITFPFKRFQIQPVWRADRPQKGRYREFYQCDADVVGSNSLLNEVELINMVRDVFKSLNISVQIKINNRKILAGIAEYIGAPDRIIEITTAIDKLEKIGLENVNNELQGKGLSDTSIDNLQPILSIKGNNEKKIKELTQILDKSEIGLNGLEEIKKIFDLLNESSAISNIELDLTLARGLNYYTGAIIEVKSSDVEIGSICGGGRYDDLTSVFGLSGISGVGISFGADRIYDVLNQLNGYPKSIEATTQVLLINFGEKEQLYCLSLASKLRSKGVSAELFPDPSKLKKQLSYANNKNIPWVIFAGEHEIEKGELTLKNMISGEQNNYSPDKIVELLCNSIEHF